MLARTLLLAGASLNFAPGAFGQARTVWDVQHINQPNSYVRQFDLLPRPDGGVVSVGAAYSSASGTATVEALAVAMGENGDVLWSWSAPIQGAAWGDGFRGDYVSAASDAQGAVYVAHSRDLESSLVKLEADGTVAWSRDLPRVFPENGAFQAIDVDVSPAGDLVHVVGCGYRDTWPRSGIYTFDAQGQLAWTWPTVPAGDEGLPVGLKVDADGDVHIYGQTDYFASYDYTEMRREFSAAGALLGVGGGPSSSFVSTSGGAVDHLGNAGFVSSGSVSNFPNSDPYVALQITGPGWASGYFDLIPAGLNPSIGHRVAFDGAGNALVFGVGNEILRVSPTAGFLPSFQVPSMAQIQDVRALPGGGLLVSGGFGSSGNGDDSVDARLDAQGATLWSQRRRGSTRHPLFRQLGLPVGGGRVVLDGRGNAFSSNFTSNLAGVAGWRVGVRKILVGDGVGSAYCAPSTPNSTGTGATLEAFGEAGQAANNLTLIASDLPPNTFVLFITSLTPGSIPGPGGSMGTLCVDGSIGRFVAPGQVRRSEQNGVASLQLDLDELPQSTGVVPGQAGQTWHFQGWYRDFVGGAPTANFSSAVSVTLQ